MPNSHVLDEPDEYLVINVNENVVKESVLAMMKHVDMCTCSKCFSDACAMVLNQLPPQYVTTRRGELFSRIPNTQMENKIDLTVKVLQVLNQVKDSPRH